MGSAIPTASGTATPASLPHGATDWTLSFFKSFGWPHVFFILGLLILLNPRLRRQFMRILRRITHLKTGVVEIELQLEESTDYQEVTTKELRAYRSKIKEAYDTAAARQAIRDRLAGVYRSVTDLLASLGKTGGDIRCTVHVPDVLFDETLYQLASYYPKGGGAGRTFSTRRGIMGKAWRLGESQFNVRVPALPKTLIEDWGMTWEEAQRAAGQTERQSFAAIPLKNAADVAVGVIFIDAKPPHAFSLDGDDATARDEKLEKAVMQAVANSDLVAALASVNRELFDRAPALPVHSLDD
jgi:hypothetical protein